MIILDNLLGALYSAVPLKASTPYTDPPTDWVQEVSQRKIMDPPPDPPNVDLAHSGDEQGDNTTIQGGKKSARVHTDQAVAAHDSHLHDWEKDQDNKNIAENTRADAHIMKESDKMEDHGPNKVSGDGGDVAQEITDLKTEVARTSANKQGEEPGDTNQETFDTQGETGSSSLPPAIVADADVEAGFEKIGAGNDIPTPHLAGTFMNQTDANESIPTSPPLDKIQEDISAQHAREGVECAKTPEMDGDGVGSTEPTGSPDPTGGTITVENAFLQLPQSQIVRHEHHATNVLRMKDDSSIHSKIKEEPKSQQGEVEAKSGKPSHQQVAPFHTPTLRGVEEASAFLLDGRSGTFRESNNQSLYGCVTKSFGRSLLGVGDFFGRYEGGRG